MPSNNDDCRFIMPESSALLLKPAIQGSINFGGRKGKADRRNLQTNQKTVNGDMFGQFPIVLQIQAAKVLVMFICVFCYVRKG